MTETQASPVHDPGAKIREIKLGRVRTTGRKTVLTSVVAAMMLGWPFTIKAPAAETAYAGLMADIEHKVAKDKLPLLSDITTFEQYERAYVDTKRILEAYHVWSVSLRHEYEFMMDMHDPNCKAELKKLTHVADAINKMHINLVAQHDRIASETPSDWSQLTDAQSQYIGAQFLKKQLLSGVDLQNFQQHAQNFWKAHSEMAKIGARGEVWTGGIVRTLDSLFGLNFKHEGSYKLTRHGSAALLRLYHDMTDAGMLRDEAVVVTEGWHLTHDHQSTGHKEGWAWDCRSESKNFSDAYIIKMFTLAATSSHYDIRYEPDTRSTAGLAQKILNHIHRKYPRMNEVALKSWIEARIGNGKYTNEPHFHMTTKNPDERLFATMAQGPQTTGTAYASGGD
ncbi:MAG: hypothetical protein AAB573_00430 [Patescibacteria group bacterium]